MCIRDSFKLAVEAKRIDLAFLFDPMMAIHTSNVDALPHQITAVYESMLPRQPLRFVLADDPGAGKTIMAGLYTVSYTHLRKDAKQYKKGLVVKFHQNAKAFKRGEKVEVLGEADGTVTVKRSDGKRADLRLSDAERFQVYHPAELLSLIHI